jgi:CheY-like chemotaxis protein
MPRSSVTNDHPAGSSSSSAPEDVPQREQVRLTVRTLPLAYVSPVTLVLVVDDEPDVRLVARVVLTSAGHEVVEAESGEAALAFLEGDRRPDAVLLDVRMPGIDGWEVLRQLRDDPESDELPVVIFTANLTARADAPATLQTYDHFLTKPFKPDELLGAVEHAMQDPSGSGD